MTEQAAREAAAAAWRAVYGVQHDPSPLFVQGFMRAEWRRAQTEARVEALADRLAALLDTVMIRPDSVGGVVVIDDVYQAMQDIEVELRALLAETADDARQPDDDEVIPVTGAADMIAKLHAKPADEVE